jgi:hypothetical protein
MPPAASLSAAYNNRRERLTCDQVREFWMLDQIGGEEWAFDYSFLPQAPDLTKNRLGESTPDSLAREPEWHFGVSKDEAIALDFVVGRSHIITLKRQFKSAHRQIVDSTVNHAKPPNFVRVTSFNGRHQVCGPQPFSMPCEFEIWPPGGSIQIR